MDWKIFQNQIEKGQKLSMKKVAIRWGHIRQHMIPPKDILICKVQVRNKPKKKWSGNRLDTKWSEWNNSSRYYGIKKKKKTVLKYRNVSLRKKCRKWKYIFFWIRFISKKTGKETIKLKKLWNIPIATSRKRKKKLGTRKFCKNSATVRDY